MQRGLGEAEQRQLQLDALVVAAGHVLQRVAQRADGTDGLALAHLRCLGKIELFFLRRHTGQQRPPAGQRRQHQAAIVGNQLFREALHVHRLLAQPGQLGQGCHAIPRRHRVRNAEQIAPVGHARHAAHHILVDLGRDARAGIQNGECIAQRAVCQAGDQLCAARREPQPLLLCDIGHPARDILRADAGEIIPLAAG